MQPARSSRRIRTAMMEKYNPLQVKMSDPSATRVSPAVQAAQNHPVTNTTTAAPSVMKARWSERFIIA
jgi:hypothetical protein